MVRGIGLAFSLMLMILSLMGLKPMTAIFVSLSTMIATPFCPRFLKILTFEQSTFRCSVCQQWIHWRSCRLGKITLLDPHLQKDPLLDEGFCIYSHGSSTFYSFGDTYAEVLQKCLSKHKCSARDAPCCRVIGRIDSRRTKEKRQPRASKKSTQQSNSTVRCAALAKYMSCWTLLTRKHIFLFNYGGLLSPHMVTQCKYQGFNSRSALLNDALSIDLQALVSLE